MATTITFICLLILAGLVFFFLEIITPSFGVLTALAVASLAGAAWLGFTISSTLGFVMIGMFFISIPAFWALAVRLLPRSPLGKRMFLGDAPDGSAAGTPEADELAKVIGKTGVAETPLRPSGAVRVNGRRYVAAAESGMIDSGAAVKVLRSSGMNLIVRKIDSK